MAVAKSAVQAEGAAETRAVAGEGKAEAAAKRSARDALQSEGWARRLHRELFAAEAGVWGRGHFWMVRVWV